MSTKSNRGRHSSSARRSGSGRTTPAELMAAAERARRGAYAPYSGFAVGAALLTDTGEIVSGCNVENASFGLSMCAERNAIAHAVCAGHQQIVAVAVTAGPRKGVTPCGACRQVLYEFGPDMWVYWRDGRGGIVRRRLRSLLDRAFGPKRLGG